MVQWLRHQSLVQGDRQAARWPPSLQDSRVSRMPGHRHLHSSTELISRGGVSRGRSPGEITGQGLDRQKVLLQGGVVGMEAVDLMTGVEDRPGGRRGIHQTSGEIIHTTSNFTRSPRLNRTGGRKEVCISPSMPLVECDPSQDPKSYTGFMVRRFDIPSTQRT